MRTTSVPLNNPLKAILLGGLLALSGGVGLQVAQAAKAGLYATYFDWAIANEWVNATDPTNLVWQSGREPTDDKDNDGLSNIEEFEGWETTINGHPGWYTYNTNNVPGGTNTATFFGFGPDPDSFDTDCDGLSDLYESRKLPKFASTNPRSEDTDQDKLKDIVEIYAGMDACDDGYVYTTYTNHTTAGGTVTITGAKMADPDIPGAFVVTLQLPDMDIDGDGLSTKDELKPANKINFGVGCPETGQTREHAVLGDLNTKRWTNPFDCDSDSDWLLDSFEKAFSGFNPVEGTEVGDTYHWLSDPEADGLVNLREQCLHPLLNAGWVPGPPYPTWPFPKSDSPMKPKLVSAVGARYLGTSGIKNRVLYGTVGYLVQAQYNKFGDQARWFTATYLADGTPDEVTRMGAPGTVSWPLAPKTYWTEPRPGVNRQGWDTDGDMLTDGWEVEHGLNPLSGRLTVSPADEETEEEDTTVSTVFTTAGIDPAGTFGDPDNDGLVNLEEYFGQDGYRVNYVTGTGDETIPWITRPLNYHSQSSFEDYLNTDPIQGVYYFLARHYWQAPVGFDLVSGLDTIYNPALYPGFFSGLSLAQTVTNYVPIDPTNLAAGLTAQVQAMLLPSAGVPAFPLMANDMATLAPSYGPDFPALGGEGGFQPFATAFSGFYYREPPGAEDGRYTPGVDNLWYSLNYPDYFTPTALSPLLIPMGDIIVSDPDGELAAAEAAGTDYIPGAQTTDNAPLVIPMPGKDSDSDGLPDAMEIQMDTARGKSPTCPVVSANPLVPRSAKIVDDAGTRTLFVDYPYYFTRDFTVEAWVFLEGDAPAAGSFVKGFMQQTPTLQLKAYDLGVTNVVNEDGTTNSTVPYIGMHTMAGKWYQVSSPRSLPRNQWVHLAGTFRHDDNRLALYINGTLAQWGTVYQETVANYLQSVFGAGGQLEFAIGSGFANRLWLDETRVWGVERTSAQIAAGRFQLLQGRQGLTMDGRDLNGALLAYYNFDDGGNVAVDGRHRAMSSLEGYDYPALATITNRLIHEYFYPDRAYALPIWDFGGGFVFDANRAAPVQGELDADRGELDSDGDGLPDSWELVNEFNPFTPLTPDHLQAPRYDTSWAVLPATTGTVTDANQDYDGDGLSNVYEYWAHTNPRGPDTDEDGIVDGEEDFDGDGLSNRLEARLGSRPDMRDTDDDGDIDSVEQANSTSPVHSGSPAKSLALYLDGHSGSYLDISDQTKLQLSSWTLEAKVLPTDLDSLANGQGATIVRRTVQDTADNKMAANFELRMVRSGTNLLPEVRYIFVDGDGNGSNVWVRGNVANAAHRLPVASANDPYPSAGLVHLAGTYNGSNGQMRLYMNGVLLTNRTFAVQSRPPQGGEGTRSFMRIGENFAGFVDDIRIWSVVHSADEIDAYRTTAPSATAPGLVGLFTLDDGGFPAIPARSSVRQTLGAPPVSPVAGERYLVAVGATGDWAGHDNALAEFSGSVWRYTEPALGVRVLDEAAATVLEWDGATWAAPIDPAIVRGVDYPAEPDASLKMDGISWLNGTDIVTLDSGTEYSSPAPADVFCEGAMATGAPVPGGLHWWASRSVYYRFIGGTWLEWGPSLYNISPVRLRVDRRYQTKVQMLAVATRVVGDHILVDDEDAVYTVMDTDGTNINSYLAEPINEDDRFLVTMAPYNGVVVWKGGAPQVLATAVTFGGNVHVLVRNEGVAYKSDGTLWRRWSRVPTLEDYTAARDWENEWRHAGRVSGYGSLRLLLSSAGSGSDGSSGTGTAQDGDNDGLPDDWEVANGLDPCDSGITNMTNVCTGALITNNVNGAEGDPDGDGISNYWEYMMSYDPFDTDSDDDGIEDGDEDFDGDSLSNISEITEWGTDPTKGDTDDDLRWDNEEIKQNTSPLYSRSPLKGRSMAMNGVAVTIPEPRALVDGKYGPQRFQALERWYLCAMVRPDAAQTGSLIRRQLLDGMIHFELGLEGNVPFVQFNDITGNVYRAAGTVALPTNRFSSLIAEWSPTNHVLRLLVDNCVVGATNVIAPCVKGAGQTVIGDDIRGNIDDVFIGQHLEGGSTPAPDYVLMIDVSGSMGAESRIDQAKEAALVAIDTMPKGASMAIITFDHQVEKVQDFTTDRNTLKTLVNSLVPLGATSYSAPVSKMIELISNRVAPGGFVGILISDGEPNSGVPTAADLANVVSLGAKINTVGFGSSILAGSTYELERIATGTGGTFFPAPGGSELAQILTALVTLEKTEDTCFYPFDDDGLLAEDYTQLLDWDYAIENVLFDAVRFSTEITPFNYSYVDAEDELPEWWLNWFLPGSDEIEPENDPDGDGLTNLNEWRITFMNEAQDLPALSPVQYDSNGNGTWDGDEDHDGDTLISKDEQVHGSRVDRQDTDDAGLDDNGELRAGSDPSYSMIPYEMKALRFGAAAGVGEILVQDQVRGEDTEHLSAKDWTVECFVQPEAVPPVGVDQPLVQRRLRCSDRINYELGIRNNGSGQIVPYVRFNHFNDANLVELTTDVTLPTNQWAHLAGRLAEGSLSLFIDGQIVRSMITDYDPAQGPGDAYFGGNGFRGRLKEVRIWKIGRRNVDIQEFSRRTLLFGVGAADSGLLRVSGDDGHLREVAAPNTARDQLQDWTLECWVRTADAAGTIISRVNTGNANAETDDFNYYLGVDQGGRLVGKFAIQWREVTVNTNGTTTVSELKFNTTANTLVSAITVNDGQWHHVAYTRDEANATLYVDGELVAIQPGFLLPGGVASTLQDQSMRVLEGPVEIGRSLAGDIDEVRIWGRALSVTELRSAIGQNLYGSESGLVSYFNFDFQQGAYAEDRAALRNPDMEYGTYVPNAQHVRTADQAPIENFFPLRVYALTSLLGYYTADDGGETLENLVYQNNWDYAGRLAGDVAFDVLPVQNRPFLDDSDGDGLPDWWETLYDLDPNSDRENDGAYGDPDHDGLTNLAEYLAGTNPTDWDTDGDGISDYDSNDPLCVGNCLSFGEYFMDGDLLPDAWELLYSDVLSPLVNDANTDPDGDGWRNLGEYLGTGYDLVVTESATNLTAVTPTRPNDPASYPVPEINFTFSGDVEAFMSAVLNSASLEKDNLVAANSPGVGLVVWAFSDPMMRKADAKTLIPLSGPFVSGSTATVNRWTTGHLRQGANIFMAFVDANNDGIWNAGEWMGFGENETDNIQWGSADVRIVLTDKPAGYIRFSWEQDLEKIAAGLSQVNGTTYLVAIKSLGTAGQPVIYSATRNLESLTRAFITEIDLKLAGVAPMYGAYQWSVGTADGTAFVSGTNSVTYPATLAAPTIYAPYNTTLVHAKNRLRLGLSKDVAQLTIQILRGATTVYSTTKAVPVVNNAGVAEMDLPWLAGWNAFTNGDYTIRVTASNPRATSANASGSFSVNLQSAPVGAGTIQGKIGYFGTNTGNRVVEAFAGAGFDQTAAARVRVAADGSFTLLGLPAGTYHVRGYVDLDSDGYLDSNEPWGFLKGEPSGGAILSRRAVTRSSSGSEVPYATEFSVKSLTLTSQGAALAQNLLAYDALAYWRNNVDSDGDGLTDDVELALGTNPMRWDSDFDGLSDLYEVSRIPPTEPTIADTDNDGLSDGQEILVYLTNPLLWDHDGDGYSDGAEVAAGTDPRNGLVHPTRGITVDTVITRVQPTARGAMVTYNVDNITPSGSTAVIEFMVNPELTDGLGWTPSGVQRVLTAPADNLTDFIPDTNGNGVLNIRIRTK